MEHNNKASADQLNKLVEINNDRIEGYKTAQKETEDSDLQTLFKRMENHSQNFRAELASEVQKLGEKPIEGTRETGKLYRAWMDIKAALTAKDRKAILSSCEFGEDVALKTYEEVLENNPPLPFSLRELVLRQKKELALDHDHIKSLRDSQKANT